MKPTDEMVEAYRNAYSASFNAIPIPDVKDRVRSALTAALASLEAGAVDRSHHEDVVSDARKLAHEINEDVMAGEAEIAAAIQAGFDFRERRLREQLTAPAPSGMAVEALETAEAWIDRHTRHIGSCFDFPQCTCGRTAVLYELREALSALKAEEAGS